MLLKARLSFKETLLALKAKREGVRQGRDEWKAHRQPRMREQVRRLIFLDETGTTTKMTRLRGRARRGAWLKPRRRSDIGPPRPPSRHYDVMA